MKRTLTEWRWSRRVLCAALAAGAIGLIPASLAVGQPAPPANPAEVDAAQKLLLKASGAFNRGMFKPAVGYYQEFIQAYPNHAEVSTARFALGVCHYRLAEYDKAIETLTLVLKDPKFAQRDEALAVIGHSHLTAGRHEPALAAFEELLAKHPQSKHAEVASLNRAHVLLLTGKFKESGVAAQEFITKFPQSTQKPAALYFLALSQKEQSQNDQVIATLTTLNKDHPGNAFELDAALLMGQAYEAQNALDKAAEQYKAFLAKAPNARKPDGQYSLGVVQYKAAQFDDAAKSLEAVVEGAPGSQYAKPARLQLGLVHLANNKIDSARKVLSDVVKDDPASGAAAKYGLAQCDIADKKYQPAYDTLDALLKADPKAANAPQITLDRAVCLAELAKHEQAAAEFAAFATQYPTSPQVPEAKYRQAFSLHQLAKYDQSHALCLEVIKSPSKEMAAAAAELDAENLFLLANYPEAAKAYEALAAGTKDEDAKLRFGLRLGQCAYFAADYPKAVTLLTPLAANPKVEKSEALSRAIFLLGDAQLQQGKNADAAAALTKYLSVAKGEGKTDRPEAQYKLGLAQLRAGETASAQKSFAAVAAGPADSQWTLRALLESGKLAYEAKPPQLEAAAAALAKVVAVPTAPKELLAPATYLLAWIDFDQKKYEPAAAKWATVVEKHAADPLAVDAAFQRGVALHSAAKHEDALAALTAFAKAHEKDPKSIRARQLAAQSLVALKRDDEAKQMLAALATDKNAGEAVLYDLAWSQKNTKDNAAATATYQRLLAEHPQGQYAASARTELAELLYNEKKYAEAVALLEPVVADENAKADVKSAAMYRLAWCYDQLGQKDKAGVMFAKFSENGSGDTDVVASALLQGGLAHATQKNWVESEKAFASLLQKHPKYQYAALAQLKLGQVQAEQSKFDASMATLTDFLAKYPKDERAYEAQFGIGWALEHKEQYDPARAAYKKVIAMTNTEYAARAQLQVGETLAAEGKFDAAIPELLAVEDVYAYPQWSAKALFEAGRVYEQLKQNDMAKQHYAAVVSKYKDKPEAALAQERLKALGAE